MWVGSGARVDGYGEARNEFVCRGQIDDRCYAKPCMEQGSTEHGNDDDNNNSNEKIRICRSFIAARL